MDKADATDKEWEQREKLEEGQRQKRLKEADEVHGP